MADGSVEQGRGGAIHSADGAISSDTVADTAELVESRLRAAMAAARFHGTELDRRDFRAAGKEPVPSPAALVDWLKEGGLWAKAARVKFRQLLRFTNGAPVILLFADGSAGLLTATDPVRNVVAVKDPRAA